MASTDASSAESDRHGTRPGRSESRITRRSLLKVGAAAAVGTTAIATSSGDAEEPDGPITAATLGTIVSVDSGALRVAIEAGSRAVDVADLDQAAQEFGEGVRSQPDAETVTVNVPGSDGFWKPGHRAVLIEQYSDQGWKTIAIQHLIVPIEPQQVVDRDGTSLTTNDSVVEITQASQPAPPAWDDTETVPLAQVESGDTVAGLGYRSPGGDKIEAAALGVDTGT